MTHIRSTLAALLVMGGAAFAQAGAQQPAQQPIVAAHRAQKAMGPGRKNGMRAERALLKGVKLSDAEKANLKNVREKYKAQTKALREQYKPQHEQIRAARQRGDTAAVRSLLAQTAGERQQERALLQSERNDIRAALSPQNQAAFDANVAKMKTRLAQHGAKGRGKPGKLNGGF